MARHQKQTGLASTAIILICFIPNLSFADKFKLAIGTVSEVKGAPDVLREPSKNLTQEMKTKAKADGYATVLYNNAYWKAYPVIPGSKIFYGDVLSSGPESKMVITLHDGFKIILAKNTKVRLTPNFIKNNPIMCTTLWTSYNWNRDGCILIEKLHFC